MPPNHFADEPLFGQMNALEREVLDRLCTLLNVDMQLEPSMDDLRMLADRSSSSEARLILRHVETFLLTRELDALHELSALKIVAATHMLREERRRNGGTEGS